MKKIFQRLPLGRGMDVLSYGYAFWINQCTSGFHGLEEPGGSRGSFKVGVGAAEEGKVVCLVFQEWAKEQEEAFQTLKDNLCDAPILSLPDGSKEFVVYCDASNQGLGCVLMQRGKVENATAEMLCGLDQLIERKEDGGMKFIWVPLIDDVRTLIMDEAHASRVEVGDKVTLEVSSWKDVVHFGKKEMLAPRYKYLADTDLHGHLEEIKVDKTFRFVEPVEIIDREVKSLKRSRIPIVKFIGTRREVMRIS
ncbi:putative reverse transcriptase domain-containing protein [Tanacetum coccineum]